VFPLFPTLLLLIKKRAAPDTHGLAISVIYGTDSISSMHVTSHLLCTDCVQANELVYLENGGVVWANGHLGKVQGGPLNRGKK
jgi:hypothetical protein